MAGHHHLNHSHDHHAHALPARFGRAFAIGIGLNLAYVAAEAFAGWRIGSMALLADAGHNLSDVAGLVIAWAALHLAGRAASARFTYGWRRSGILAALANAVLLLFACGAIAVEAVHRLMVPAPVPGGVVMIVAGVGIIVNAATAWLFARAGSNDVNIRGAWLHMAADAAVSAAVVVSGFLIVRTGAQWLDPLASLLVVAVILRGTWGLLTESLAMAMDGVPRGIDAGAVAGFLGAQTGVAAVHDLHIWAMGSSETALTAHLVMPAGHPGDAALAGLVHDLEHRFGIDHATLQVDIGDCAQIDCGKVDCGAVAA
ncbi:cobalt transporter [alpha proteobacterium AAP81b]|nr:cobalt transporter [alpha proteobacterium AAP81b]